MKRMEGNNRFVENETRMISIEAVKTAMPFSELFEIRDADLEQVMDSIRQKGYDTLYPLVLWNEHENTVVDGHTRLSAAIKLGYKQVPAVYRAFADEAEALEHTIAAQRIRRSLSPGEIIKCFFLLKTKLEHQAEDARVKGLTPPSGRTTEVIADLLGSTRGTIDKVERITRQGEPELVKAVEKDEITINKAHEIVKEAERRKRGVERIEKVMEKNHPKHQERFLMIKDFGRKVSKLYEEILNTNVDEFSGDDIKPFFWGDLRKELIARLDRDLICHLGKPGEADEAINYTKSRSDFDDDLDYYYESLQEKEK